MTDDWHRQRLANGLMDDAHELLAKKRFKKAWKIGRRLATLNFSGSYEIRAKAFEGLGRSGAARAVLARGVRRAPNAWMLWLLLANAQSDAGFYDTAIETLETGRTRGGDIDLAAFRVNHALVLIRAGRSEEAAALLDAADPAEPGADDPELIAFMKTLRDDIAGAAQLPFDR